MRTFLIADVRGYTRFTRERGDLAAARLASRFAELARDAVAARGGRVIELRGDEALAVFASARQAVRAALELQATLAEETAGDPSLPLPVGIGIDSGEAVPVEGGYRGAALNMAARLCSQAQAGQVFVSEAVRAPAEGIELGVFRRHGLIELKGFEQPVVVYEALASVGRLETTPRSIAPEPLPLALTLHGSLVGRESELAWLRGTWRAARRGRGRVLFVSGGPGSGKTSLAATLAAHVAAQGYPVRYSGVGGAALAQLAQSAELAATARSPVLVVLDDLDVSGDPAAELLTARLEAVERAPALVVGMLSDADSLPALAQLIDRCDARGDGYRRLGPLGASEVQDLAVLYTQGDAAEVPVESILRGSAGVPARVHELLDEWTREEAARRLEAAAEWIASGRDRRTASLDFANNAIELRLRRIFATSVPAAESELACPYKGLAQFGANDADWFFGRERLVGDLAARTVATGLLAVVGPSGSGKSSLVAAGLLPSLATGLLPGSRRWQAVTTRPGPHPLATWPGAAVAQAHPEHRLVLVVDQFEEAFTLCADDDERSAFLAGVVAASADPERVVVVVVIRGDYLDRIAAHPALAELVSANQVLVAPMSREEYHRAIEQPSRRCGVRVESALADALVDEATGEPGALPLLSTALVELWAHRSDGWLRMDAYRETGGLEGAVARLAEASYVQLSEPARRTARTIFLRLVAISEGDAVTRRRVPLSELDVDRDPEVAAVLARFVDDRLLTRDGDTIEVAHEALLREWPRVATWLRDDALGRELRQHITQAATHWERNGRRAGDLYRAERLAAALEWSRHNPDQLNRLEREFLGASQVSNARAVRRLRIGIGVLGVLLAAAVVAGLVALSLRRSAQQEARAATHEAQIAIGQRVGIQAEHESDLARSLLLAVQGYRLDPSAETGNDLLATLLRARSAITVFHAPTRLLAPAVSPDGRVLAVADNAGRVWLYDTRTGSELGRPIVPGDGLDPPGVAFSPDGATLALFSDAHGHGVIELFDVRSRRLVSRVREPQPATSFDSAAFSSDGRFLAAIRVHRRGLATPSRAHLVEWRVDGMRPIATPSPVAITDANVAFVPSGPIVTRAPSGVATWSPSSLQRLRRYRVPSTAAALSPDGRTLALLERRRVELLDLRGGATRAGPVVPAGALIDLAYTADGRSLVGVNARQTAITRLDLDNGALSTVGREPGLLPTVAVAPNGSGIYTASLDGTAVRWSLQGGRVDSWFRYAPAGMGTLVLAVSSHGLAATVAAPTYASARLWQLGSGRPLGGPLSAGPGGVGWIAFGPDGRELAVANASTGSVALWDVATRRVARLVPPVPRSADAVAVSPDGQLVAAGTQLPKGPLTYKSGYLTVWNAHSRAIVDEFHQPGDNGISWVSFSADGRRIASVGESGRVAIWDIRRHRLLRTWTTSDAYTLTGVFAPGGMLATAGYGGGLATLWNASTGRDFPPPIASGPGVLYPVGYYDGGREIAIAHANGDCKCAGQVQLWNVPGRRRLGTLTVGGPLPGAALEPRGDRLVTTSKDGLLTTWKLSPASWVVAACRIANRSLTPVEWATYLAHVPYRRTCP